MPFSRFAGWISFSFFIALPSLFSQPPIQIKIQDGSTISFPSGFNQVVRPKSSILREVVIGFQTDSQVRVVFVHSPEKIPFQPEKILAEALSIDRIHLQPLGAAYAEGIHRNPIHLIFSESGYNQQYLAFDRRYYHGGGAFFFLLGTDEDFFEFVPIFENMVDHFAPSKPRYELGMGALPIWVVFGAILVLGLNILAIFWGFKEMAHLQT